MSKIAQEPVAWFVVDAAGYKSFFDDEQKAHEFAEWANGGGRTIKPLYTTPQPCSRCATLEALANGQKEKLATIEAENREQAERIRELEERLSRSKEQSANRLIGLCKCGDERESLEKKLTAAEVVIETVFELLRFDLCDESRKAITTYRKGKK